MPERRLIQPQFVRLEAVEQHQDLADGRRPRGGRAHAADPGVAIGVTDRVPFDHPVIGEIGGRQRAGHRPGCHRRDDRLGDRPVVEGIWAPLGQRRQCFGQRGLAQHRARRRRPPARAQLFAGGRAIEPRAEPAEQHGKARCHLEPVPGMADRRGEELGPGQLAVARVQFLHQPDHARHADRAAADDRCAEGQRLRPVQEHLGRRAGRCRFAGVIADQTLPGMHQRERPAADAARLRLDHVQHQQGGNRGIRR